MSKSDEVWKTVNGYESLYKISSHGRIVSTHFSRPRILSPTMHTKGYLRVSLVRDGIRRCEYMHKLVAHAFLGEPPRESPYVNHKNGVKTDNRVDNLEYVSAQQNTDHAMRTGLFRFGESSAAARHTREQVLAGYELVASGWTVPAAARESGVSVGALKSAVNGKTWGLQKLKLRGRTARVR